MQIAHQIDKSVGLAWRTVISEMLCNRLSLHNRRPYLYQGKGADNIYGAFVPRPMLPLSGERWYSAVIQCHLDGSSGVKRRDFGVALINTAAPLAFTSPLPPIHTQHLDTNYNLSCH